MTSATCQRCGASLAAAPERPSRQRLCPACGDAAISPARPLGATFPWLALGAVGMLLGVVLLASRVKPPTPYAAPDPSSSVEPGAASEDTDAGEDIGLDVDATFTLAGPEMVMTPEEAAPAKRRSPSTLPPMDAPREANEGGDEVGGEVDVDVEGGAEAGEPGAQAGAGKEEDAATSDGEPISLAAAKAKLRAIQGQIEALAQEPAGGSPLQQWEKWERFIGIGSDLIMLDQRMKESPGVGGFIRLDRKRPSKRKPTGGDMLGLPLSEEEELLEAWKATVSSIDELADKMWNLEKDDMSKQEFEGICAERWPGPGRGPWISDFLSKSPSNQRELQLAPPEGEDAPKKKSGASRRKDR